MPKQDNTYFRGSRIISDQIDAQGLQTVLDELESVLTKEIPGHIVEFGCYIGTTSIYIRRSLDEYGESAARELHVYDSFTGLPEKSREDQSSAGTEFKAGELSVGKKELLTQFKKSNVRPPIVHKGWFHDLTDRDVPEPIAFAFLDGDFYESILDSLRLIWPKLSPGSVVVIDDYGREALPGVERAVQVFFRNQNVGIEKRHGRAIIRQQVSI